MPEIRLIKSRIYEDATDEQTQVLKNDDNYGAPYSFWRTALDYGLINQAELEQARQRYGDLWFYRGD